MGFDKFTHRIKKIFKEEIFSVNFTQGTHLTCIPKIYGKIGIKIIVINPTGCRFSKYETEIQSSTEHLTFLEPRKGPGGLCG